MTALAPTRHCTGVLGRVKVPRAPRAAARTPAATLTPPPRARRKATIGASRNHEREHHGMPVILLADRGIERPGVRMEDQIVAGIAMAVEHRLSTGVTLTTSATAPSRRCVSLTMFGQTLFRERTLVLIKAIMIRSLF